MKIVKISFFFALLIAAQCMTSLMAQYSYFNNGVSEFGILSGYTLQGQQQNQWCWAASGSMVMTYVSSPQAPSQCTEATDRNGGDCCSNGSSSTCNQPGWPQFDKYGYSNKQTANGTPLSFEQIQKTLIGNSPIAFAWYWTSGGGHMMTVCGWAIISGQKFVLVYDPWPVNKGTTKWLAYDAYIKGSNYRHGPDLYDFTR